MQSTALSTALAIGAQPHRTILLRHDLPVGSQHFDWMIAGDPEGAGPLLTFRCANRVDQLGAGQSMTVEQLADHRPMYLDYEGPVSGGRGTVTRICRGEVISSWRDDTSPVPAWEIAVSWRGSTGAVETQGLRLAKSEGDLWQLSTISPDSRSSHRALTSNVETVLDIPRYTK